jgi:hypothetical protein
VARNVAVCPSFSFVSIWLSDAPPEAEVLVVVLLPPAAVVVVAPEPDVVVVVPGDDEELQAVAPRAMAARASEAARRPEDTRVDLKSFAFVFMGQDLLRERSCRRENLYGTDRSVSHVQGPSSVTPPARRRQWAVPQRS